MYTFSPEYYSLTSSDPMTNNATAFLLAESHFGIQKLLKSSEMDKPDRLALFTYLSNFYAVFKELDPPEKTPAASIKTPPSKPPRRHSQGRSPHYRKILMTPPSAERSWTTRTSTTRKHFRSTKKDKKKEKEKEGKKEDVKLVAEETVPLVTKSNIKKLSPASSSASSVESSKKQSTQAPAKPRSSSSSSLAPTTTTTTSKNSSSRTGATAGPAPSKNTKVC